MLANSDTQVSNSFIRPPEFVGATSAATSNTLTVSGSPFTANQFIYAAGSQPKTYYVLIGPHSSTNPKQGLMYQITGNTTNTLTLNTNGDDVSGIAATTQILVIPYHTLNSMFPASDLNVSYVASPNQFARQTQVIIPNYSGTGINLSSAATYYYLNNAWRKFGDSTAVDHGDDLLPMGQPPGVAMPSAAANAVAGHMTIRNAGTATTLTTLGSVLTKVTTIPLFTRTSGQQDNFVSIIRPLDVSLNNLGLITSGAFQTSPSQFNRVDQLLVFDPTQASQNKSASKTYFYMSGAWRLFGDPGLPDRGSDLISAGAGFVIRKGATATGAPVFWMNAPTY